MIRHHSRMLMLLADAVKINFDVAGGIKAPNFEYKQGLIAVAAANGKLYSMGGVAADYSHRLSQGSANYWNNRQSHLGIYDPATDNWDSAYWRDWSVLGFINQYPVNGQPTGLNYNIHTGGTVKPTDSDGAGYVQNQGTAWDWDNDGTVETYCISGYPMWAPLCLTIYDPDTNAWSQGPSPVGLNISAFRRGAAAQEGS